MGLIFFTAFQNKNDPIIIPTAIATSNLAKTPKLAVSTSLTKTGNPIMAGPIIKMLFTKVSNSRSRSPLWAFTYFKPSTIPCHLGGCFSSGMVLLGTRIRLINKIEKRKLMASAVNKCVRPNREIPTPANKGPSKWDICPETEIAEFAAGSCSEVVI